MTGRRGVVVAVVWLGLVGRASAEPVTQARFGLALRLRPEIRTNPDLDSSEDDTLAFVGSRLRAHAQLDALEHVRLYAQLQDGRHFGSEASPTADEATLDLHQGWMMVYGLACNRLDVKAGRLELSYGDDRLVGVGAWSDVGRVFDGAVVHTQSVPSLAVDAFGAVVRERRTIRVVDDTGSSTDQYTSGDGLAGVFAAWKPVPEHEVDAYLFARFDGPTASPRVPERERRIFSPGLRAAGTVGGVLRYGVEGTVQTGISNGTCPPPCTAVPQSPENDHFAWGVAASLQLTMPWTAAPFVGAELDLASGDGDPLDGDSRELDNFFPSNHPQYGTMDIIGWRNLRDVRVRAGAAPVAGWTIAADVHFLGLQQRHGAWTDDAGNLMDDPELDLYDTTSRNLGTEVDLTATYSPGPFLKSSAGFSVFVPGEAARERRGDDPSMWAFVLAEVALDGVLDGRVLHSAP